jgi:hypothetical protein
MGPDTMPQPVFGQPPLAEIQDEPDHVYSCSITVPQRWQSKERSHWEYRRL